MKNNDFSEPKFMKKAQKVFHNYGKSCQSRFAFKSFLQNKATSYDFYLKVYPLKNETQKINTFTKIRIPENIIAIFAMVLRYLLQFI